MLRDRGAAEGRHAARAALRPLPQSRPGLLETLRVLPADLAAVDGGVHTLLPGPETEAGLHPAGRHRRPELDQLREAMVRVDRPERMLDWLMNPAVRRTLQAVAARGVITRKALDTLPPGRTFAHVRSMLVAAGALPDRDERLTALEHWIGQAVAGQPDPGHRQALRGYAAWHHLRRLRGRLDGLPPASRSRTCATPPRRSWTGSPHAG